MLYLHLPQCVYEGVHFHIVSSARITTHITNIAVMIYQLCVSQYSLCTHDCYTIIRNFVQVYAVVVKITLHLSCAFDVVVIPVAKILGFRSIHSGVNQRTSATVL